MSRTRSVASRASLLSGIITPEIEVPCARFFIVVDILNLHSIPVHVLFQRTSTVKSPANSSMRPVLIRLTAYVDLLQRLMCRDGDSLSKYGLGLEQ